MNSGWIKLHRQLIDNRMLMRDHTALIIFVTLLLSVRHKDGTYDVGRFQLAKMVNMNPSTVYKALKRLEKAKMVTLDGKRYYTLITICNWHEFQGRGNTASNNSVTTREQLGNTKQEGRIKNKEINTGIVFKTTELAGAFAEFEKMRNKIKKPMTDKAKELLLSKLQKMYPNQTNMQIKCLHQSIENCWQGVFPLKVENNIGVRPPEYKTNLELTDEQRQKNRETLDSMKTEFMRNSSRKTQ